MNVALIMGRGGSKSIPGKNVMPVLGRPLVIYPLLAALHARRIDQVVVTSDCPGIQRVATELKVRFIRRPDDISHDTAQMVDGILHALQEIGGTVEHLVTLHANCATHAAGLIDRCIARLEADPSADSCVSGVIDRSVHPYRTRKLTADGWLEPWNEVPANTSSNRQALDPCVILDGAARAMRVNSCIPANGSAPFPYLGRKILLEENPGGRDVHDEDDILLTERYLLRQGWTDTTLPKHLHHSGT